MTLTAIAADTLNALTFANVIVHSVANANNNHHPTVTIGPHPKPPTQSNALSANAFKKHHSFS